VNSISPTTPEIKENKGSQFKILTYNVNFGLGERSTNFYRVFDAVIKSGAHIVCLQETTENFQSLFLNAMNDEYYPNQIWKSTNNYYCAGGYAVLTKKGYRLRELSYYKPQVEGSFFHMLIVQVILPTGETVDVLNVHLRPPLSDKQDAGGTDHVKAYFGTDQVRKAELESSLAEMYRVSPSHHRKIVVGDFNEGSLGQGVRWLAAEEKDKKEYAKRKFTDALGQFCGRQSTWFWPVLGGYVDLYGSYDHIFYDSNSFQGLNCQVMIEYKYVSDHVPVLASLILK